MDAFYHEAMPNAPGIYCITCKTTGRIYVGSAINLRQRRKCHYGDLQRNEHRNQKLQRAWQKYGSEDFIFEILELVLIPELLTSREQHWFGVLNPFFNIAPIAGSQLGQKRSPESCAKMSVALIGNTHTRGKKMSPETREILRAKAIGRKVSDEARRKMSESRKGKITPPETREKMRIAALGRPVSDTSRAKISAANTGRTHRPESYSSRMKPLIAISPDGIEHTVHGVRAFCREHHLDISALTRVAQGKQHQHKGWTSRFPETVLG